MAGARMSGAGLAALKGRRTGERRRARLARDVAGDVARDVAGDGGLLAGDARMTYIDGEVK
jgi:hypothetical protein